MRFLATLFLLFSLPVTAQDWLPYPENLPHFDYQGERLQQYWPQLMAGPALPFPDAQAVNAQFGRFPELRAYTLNLPAQHTALQALARGDTGPLAQAIQQVWRLHYQGQFQQAYELGMQLGPLGAVPALYAKNMYATLLVTDPAEKLRLFRETAEESERLLPLAAGDAFARFGLAYAHARMLELMDTGDATASGYLGQTQKTLQQLQQEEPQNALYPAMLGGIHAGVVNRVGSFIGRITYGSTESKAITAFEQALALQPGLPVISYEYAKALGLMDAGSYHTRQQDLLRTCAELEVFSAEEALNRAACSRLLTPQETD